MRRALAMAKQKHTDYGIHIVIEDAGWRKALPDVATLCRRSCTEALASFPLEGNCVVTILLANDKTTQKLNTQYRHKNKPTNVLSFPNGEQDEEGRLIAGDIALAFETIQKEAIEQHKSLSDHFAHLVVHGTLHLLGFDHEKEAEARKMEALEIRILKTLGIGNPYVHSYKT